MNPKFTKCKSVYESGSMPYCSAQFVFCPKNMHEICAFIQVQVQVQVQWQPKCTVYLYNNRIDKLAPNFSINFFSTCKPITIYYIECIFDPQTHGQEGIKCLIKH